MNNESTYKNKTEVKFDTYARTMSTEQVESSDKILLTLMLSLILMTSLANVTGNGLVLASGATSRACRKRISALILNLAVADLFALVGLLSLAVDAINYVSTIEFFNEDFLMVVCHAKIYGAIAYYFAQIFSLTGIAINRCWRMVFADTYTYYYLRFGGHYVTIAFVWVVSIALFISFKIGFGLEAQYVSLESGLRLVNSTTYYGQYCIPVALSGSKATVARMSFLFLPGFIVILICAFCYAKIFRYFYDSRKELETLAAQSNNRFSTVSNNFKNLYLHIATVCILLVGQILGILMVSLSYVWVQYKPWLTLTGFLIYLLNSSINPWLSIVFIEDFACAVQAMSHCRSFRSHKRKMAVHNLVNMIH